MAAPSQQQPFRVDDFLAVFRGPKSLSEGAVSGPDKLQETVPPPRKTEKDAIPYTSIGAKSHQKPFVTTLLACRKASSGIFLFELDQLREEQPKV